MTVHLACRRATQPDALTLSVLATQVFLDTYATNGIDPALAKEAATAYSPEVFQRRLNDPSVEIHIAMSDDYLVGFLDLAFDTECPQARVSGAEVVRLYVQRPFQGRGVGRSLMKLAEAAASKRCRQSVWLTAWSGNARALMFYASLGYEDVGATEYVIDGRAYANRVLARQLPVIPA